MPERSTIVIASLAFLIMYLRWPVHRKILDCRTPETAKDQSTSSSSSTPSSDGCIGETFERGYYHYDRFFIRRSLRPSEFKMTQRGNLHVLRKERLRNEAASLRFLRRVSNIPVPIMYGAFELDDSFVLMTEYIDGVAMSQLSEDEKKTVHTEINQHLATLHDIKSNTIGGPSGIVIPPYRVMRRTDDDTWALKTSKNREYVFCHNDLSQQNIIVDPHSLKIRAIIDWEYAGFFPEYFEAHFYKRLGPSAAFNGEHDDVTELLELLRSS